MVKLGRLEEALNNVRGLFEDSEKSIELSSISTELYLQGKFEDASSIMKEALRCAEGIEDIYDKSTALRDISFELIKQAKIEEALSCARGAIGLMKLTSFKVISSIFAMDGKLEIAARLIFEGLCLEKGYSFRVRKKSKLLIEISSTLLKKGEVKKGIKCASGIDNRRDKIQALVAFSLELVNQEKPREAMTFAERISEVRVKSYVFTNISFQFIRQAKLDAALTCARRISDCMEKSRALSAISNELAKHEKLDDAEKAMKDALSVASGISDEREKIEAFMSISTVLVKQEKFEDSEKTMKDALFVAREISHEWNKSSALKGISVELAKQGKMEEALALTTEISNDYHISSALVAISAELAKQDRFDDAFLCASGIPLTENKCQALVAIAIEMAKLRKEEDAMEAMKQALRQANAIQNQKNKDEAIKNIFKELMKKGKQKEEYLPIIFDDNAIDHIFFTMCSELANESVFKISRWSVNQSYWKKMGNSMFINSPNLALKLYMDFKSEEAQIHYLKGWAEHLTVHQANFETVKLGMHYLREDVQSMEHLLQAYALNRLFFADASDAKIAQLNRTLNFQWAIDIKNNNTENDQ